MSTINVNAIDKESGSTLTLGGSGTTVAVHASATTSGFDSGLASVQTFTSSGTWTRPTGITKVMVEVQSGGGSGCYATDAVGGCGGGGGYARKFIDVSSISSATITVGSGGAGVSSNSVGNDGGNSIWSDGTNTVTANGGAGGTRTQYYGGVGGTATGGDINIQGQYGQQWGATMAAGNSVLGHAGLWSYGDTDAWLGRGYGGGGSMRYPTFGSGPSGAGSDGIVIVTEYK